MKILGQSGGLQICCWKHNAAIQSVLLFLTSQIVILDLKNVIQFLKTHEIRVKPVVLFAQEAVLISASCCVVVIVVRREIAYSLCCTTQRWKEILEDHQSRKKTQKGSSKTVQDLTWILAAGATGMIIITHILNPWNLQAQSQRKSMRMLLLLHWNDNKAIPSLSLWNLMKLDKTNAIRSQQQLQKQAPGFKHLCAAGHKALK